MDQVGGLGISRKIYSNEWKNWKKREFHSKSALTKSNSSNYRKAKELLSLSTLIQSFLKKARILRYSTYSWIFLLRKSFYKYTTKDKLQSYGHRPEEGQLEE